MVAAGTALSRLTGFARAGALAYAIGAERFNDTYTLANNTPNIVYELLIGGILASTLVPIFVKHFEDGDEDGPSAIVSVAMILLAAITILGILLAPLLVRVYTVSAGSDVSGDDRAVATFLLRLFMPQVFFMGFTALASALLNARRHFAAAAFASVLNNLVVTFVLLALPAVAGHALDPGLVRQDAAVLWFLGLGTTAGIVAMALPLWPALRRAQLHLRFRPDFRNPAVREVGRLSGWTVGYVVANQIGLLVLLVLAYGTERGVSALTFALVFFQLPHALFAVSLMTTLVPELSSAWGRGDVSAYRERFSLGLRIIALIILPASVGYVVLARPMISALLERGATGVDEVTLIAEVLAGAAVGLFGYSAYLFALRGFYALHDTRTPFLLNLGENVLAVVLAVVLWNLLGVPGLGLAWGLAYTASAVVALAVLERRVSSLDGRRVARTVGKVLVACGLMALALVAVRANVGSDSGAGARLCTAVGLVVGVSVYGLAVVLLRVDELSAVVGRFRRRSAPVA